MISAQHIPLVTSRFRLRQTLKRIWQRNIFRITTRQAALRQLRPCTVREKKNQEHGMWRWITASPKPDRTDDISIRIGTQVSENIRSAIMRNQPMLVTSDTKVSHGLTSHIPSHITQQRVMVPITPRAQAQRQTKISPMTRKPSSTTNFEENFWSSNPMNRKIRSRIPHSARIRVISQEPPTGRSNCWTALRA